LRSGATQGRRKRAARNGRRKPAAPAERIGEARTQLELAADLYQRAESVLKLQREAVQHAQAAHQEALYESRSAHSKIGEIENSINALTEQLSTVAANLGAEETSLGTCDEAPWQTQLQTALTTRTEREQQLAQARDALEGMETRLRDVEQERLTAEQRLDPLRTRINDVKLKEQEARLTEEQYASQLAESGADEPRCKDCSRKDRVPAHCRTKSAA
jgi:chromosome segregation protein